MTDTARGQRIDGVAVAAALRAEVARRATAYTAAHGHPPGLAVLLVGEDPASAVYVRNKVKACAEAGITSFMDHLPATTTEAEVLAKVAALNADARVHGILVQMPLPKAINPGRVIAAIDPRKDVDGYTVQAAGELMTGLPGLRSCTPAGCMRLIAHTGLALRGKHAVVVGRSHTVGKPMALLLLQADATVTICHSATPDLGQFTRQADVLVAAVGRADTIRADMVKPGAVVIDVGINRGADGKLCGDVNYAEVAPVASWITPVPGGVGPMTIAMLLSNTLDAAER